MPPAVVTFDHVTVAYDARRVWADLSIDIAEGSFVAILGPNGSGKTSLLRTVLGLHAPESGTVGVFGEAPRRGNAAIGYVPQRSSFDRDLPLRGRDLVRLGVDGHRWGIGLRDAEQERTVARAVAAVSAEAYADAPIGRLSGGEQQRLRIAQALVSDPRLLLCDEPLANLDLKHQQEITDLIVRWRDETRGTVLFVTHDINPILGAVDRILFVVNGRWAAGTPDEVLTSERLSELYGSHVDVVRVHDRVLVVGELSGSGLELEEAHHMPPTAPGGR